MTVTPNPMFLVAAAIAGTTAKGSLTGHWAPEIIAGSRFLGPLYTS